MKRQRLTRERIVTTALEMADHDGLEAVSLRALAAQLGVHVTSLYNHVPTKEAVLDGVVERLVAEANLPTTAVAWEAWIRQFAAALRTVAHKHPGAFAALHHRPVQGHEAAKSAEAALAAFRAAGFDVAGAYNALKSINLAVLGLVLDDLARLRNPRLRTDLSVLPVERFPQIHEASAIAPEADTWTYLIDVLVDGLSARLGRSKGGRRHAESSRRDRSRVAVARARKSTSRVSPR